MSRPEVLVVGGGLAGLAAAIRAADDGAKVTMFERAPRLGGATWSFTRDGVSYDNGQHVFMRCCTEYRRLLEKIGSAGKVHLQSRMDVPVLSPGGSTARLRRVGLPSPLHLAPALARYRHLPLTARASVARTALSLRRLDLRDDRLDAVTFERWLRDRGADAQVIDRFWDLVCVPTVNLPAREASLLLAAKVFQTGMLERADGGDIGWSKVPLQELHAAAGAEALRRVGAQVHTGCHVDRIHRGDAGVVLSIDGRQVFGDAVVVAVPHTAVGDLLPARTFPTQDRIDELGQVPIVNVHLVFDRPVLHEELVAGIDSDVQFVFDRTASSGVGEGRQCLAISLSAAHRYLAWSTRDLVSHFTAELTRLVPAADRAQLVASMVTREVAATFRGAPGSATLRPTTHTDIPGVFLAGAWTDTGWPATMEGAVRSGNAAASAVRTYLAGVACDRTGVAA